MNTDRIFLSENNDEAYLDLYIPNRVGRTGNNRPFVLVVPGGGYFFCNQREAEPIALHLNVAGLDAAVLNYSTGPKDKHPTQLRELAKAVSIIKKNSALWNTSKEVYLMGFSAGGHLACMLGTLWPEFVNLDVRPAGMVLCYPVTLSGRFENKKTFDNLCGGDEKLRAALSLEKQVSEKTVPAFIWHTGEDVNVPMENSLLFATALRQHGIPFELHVYQKGPHALSLATEITADDESTINPQVASWFDLAVAWVKNIFNEHTTVIDR